MKTGSGPQAPTNSGKVVALSFAVCALLFACCAFAQAQQPKKVFRIGILSGSAPVSESARFEVIRQALRERGYIEEQNIVIEHRYTEGNGDLAPALAAELVRLKVDIILVSGGDRWILAAKNATATIPIVMMGAGSDPIGAGFVESLGRPGGNVTGVTYLITELGGKAWSCSKRAFPN